jgi:hypothetical protein
VRVTAPPPRPGRGSRSPGAVWGRRPCPFPSGLFQRHAALETRVRTRRSRPDPPVDRHPPIVPPVFTKLDAVAMLTARLLPAPLPAPTITDLAGLPGRHRRDRPSNQDEGGRTTRESARAL